MISVALRPISVHTLDTRRYNQHEAWTRSKSEHLFLEHDYILFSNYSVGVELAVSLSVVKTEKYFTSII